MKEFAPEKMIEVYECVHCGFTWRDGAKVTCDECGTPESVLVYERPLKEKV